MVGRGVLGNPWLIKEINYYLDTGLLLEKPTAIEKIDMCIKHLRNLESLKSEKQAVLEIRSHIAWYLKGLTNSNEIKNKIFLSTSLSDIIRILDEYKDFFRKEEI